MTTWGGAPVWKVAEQPRPVRLFAGQAGASEVADAADGGAGPDGDHDHGDERQIQ